MTHDKIKLLEKCFIACFFFGTRRKVSQKLHAVGQCRYFLTADIKIKFPTDKKHRTSMKRIYEDILKIMGQIVENCCLIHAF